MKTIQLTPSCKDYLWGGEQLRTEYGIQSDLHPRVNNAFLIFRRAERDQNAHDTGVAHKGISPVKDRLFLLNTRMTFLPPLCNISCRQFLPRRDPEGQRYSLGRLCHRGCFHRGRPAGVLRITFRLVHIPHQTTHRFSTQRGAGDHSVIKIVAACQSVCAANDLFAFHGFSSVFQSSHARFRPHFSKISTIFAKSSFASLKIGSIQ